MIRGLFSFNFMQIYRNCFRTARYITIEIGITAVNLFYNTEKQNTNEDVINFHECIIFGFSDLHFQYMQPLL